MAQVQTVGWVAAVALVRGKATAARERVAVEMEMGEVAMAKARAVRDRVVARAGVPRERLWRRWKSLAPQG